MVKADLFTQEAMCTKGNGSMIKLKVKVSTCIRMEPHTQANGSTISSTATE